MTAPPCLTVPSLDRPGLRHGFFGREGGVSEGLFASLNAGLGSSDKPEHVAENRARCASALGVASGRLLTLYQAHSAAVVTVREPWRTTPPEADAMVTDRPGLALGVLTADCMPFLFADVDAGVVGAAHAGWRGALAGVIEATVDAMEALGARRARIAAALGPCLRQPNFEVGTDLVAAFVAKYPEAERFFAAGAIPEKKQFDLAAFGRWRLAEAGVAALDDTGRCTLGETTRYFSYRASRRAGEPDYGRNLSAIALQA
ncbi:MAG: peptidoglycan editing factor PgeF [Alphaproteobacteria bacterium]|nr:peptidoglycan editing factor PgeF [Alphaproteobacteria bacterium]